MDHTRFVVPARLEGERADRVVAELAGLSRSAARRLIDGGSVRFDDEVMRPSARVRSGCEVIVALPDPPGPLRAAPVDFDVLFEDEHLAVVGKPSGLVVHPGAGTDAETLAAGLLHRWPELEGVGDPDRWGIVHRLDRETSGALIIAKTPAALSALRRQLESRLIRRIYKALVEGLPETTTGTIDAPLGRDPSRPTRFRVDQDGRPARTHYRRLASWDSPGVSLLEVELETGRTHQIRVHLASIGLPVVGDAVYGRGSGGDRTWLHAFQVEFDHPATGEALAVEAPLPEELAAWLENLGPPAVGELTANS